MKIRIHGITDGKHNIKLQKKVKDLPDIFPEFIGEVELNGILTKIQNRFSFIGKAKCEANFICNICLSEYSEVIDAVVEVDFVVNTNMYFVQKDSDIEPIDIAVHENDTHYDITTDVKDFLVLSLPMRCLCYNCKDKTFEEVYMKMKTNDIPIDPRWDKLKRIN